MIQGEYPQIFQCVSCGREEHLDYFSQNLHGMLCRECGKYAKDLTPVEENVRYTLQYIATVPLGRLYTFTVDKPVQKKLGRLIHTYLLRNTDKRFKSLEILKMMTNS